MFPLIFQSLCAQEIFWVQHFASTHLCLQWHVWNVCKNIHLNENLCALLVCALLTTCVHARAQLRGNIGSKTIGIHWRHLDGILDVSVHKFQFSVEW